MHHLLTATASCRTCLVARLVHGPVIKQPLYSRRFYFLMTSLNRPIERSVILNQHQCSSESPLTINGQKSKLHYTNCLCKDEWICWWGSFLVIAFQHYSKFDFSVQGAVCLHSCQERLWLISLKWGTDTIKYFNKHKVSFYKMYLCTQ